MIVTRIRNKVPCVADLPDELLVIHRGAWYGLKGKSFYCLSTRKLNLFTLFFSCNTPLCYVPTFQRVDRSNVAETDYKQTISGNASSPWQKSFTVRACVCLKNSQAMNGAL